MKQINENKQSKLSALWRYGLAVILMAVALALTLLLVRAFSTPFWFLFLAAIMASAWFGGKGPGWVATALSVLAVDYFFIPPLFILKLNLQNLPFIVGFALSAMVTGWVSSKLKQREAALRQAREELETRVKEGTAELKKTNEALLAEITERKRAEEALRRSEAYLVEGQRLTHTGSWAYNPAGPTALYWSEEMFRIFTLDPQEGLPSVDKFFERIHPEDRDWLRERIEKTLHEKVDHVHDHRIVLPDGSVKYIHVIGHPVLNDAGDVVEVVGTLVDITERKRAEEERQAHLWFLESMDRINRAMQGTNDLEQMMSDVLDAVLSIFECDRAWLVYPCDPEATSWRAVMEHTKPEFPGAFALGIDLPMYPGVADVFRSARASGGPVCFGPGSDRPVHPQLAERFSIQSMIVMAVYPKLDKPYLFGLHQCSYPRTWTAKEERLFEEISRRLTDALTSLLMFRNLQVSEARLEEAQRIAHVGYWDRDLDTDLITWSDETYRIFGLRPEERTLTLGRVLELIHPEDRQTMLERVAEALQGRDRYDVEYRVVRPNAEVGVVHSQGNVTRDESGRPRRMFGTAQDITERKRAEEALKENVAQLSKKNRYETIISTVTRSVHQSINLQEVLENAIESMSKNIDKVQHIAIYLVEGEEAVIRAYRGFSDSFIERAGRIPYPRGLTWKTIIEGKSIYCADTDEDTAIGPAGREAGIKSYVSMPIFHKGKVVGTLNITSLQKNNFEEEELKLLETVAQQVEIAINNAQQAEALRQSEESLKEKLAHLSKKNRYETIISTVTQSVHKSINLQEVLENAVESMNENIDKADAIAIYVVKGEEAILKAHRGFPDMYVERAGRIAFPKGFTWNVITEGKPRYCSDVDEDTLIGPAGREVGTKSYLSMPILFESETVGTINVHSFRKNAFDEEELKLLEIVAQQISVAINNARQAEALRQSEETLRESLTQLSKKSRYESIVSAVTQSVHRSINLQEVLENAVESMSKNIDTLQRVEIFLVEGEEAVLKAYRNLPDWFLERVKRIPYPKGFTWKTIIEGKSRYVADVDEDTFIGPAGREVGTKSYVSMPIFFEGKAVGALNITSPQKNAFSEDDIKLLEIVSQQVGTAISNAQKAEELRRAQAELTHVSRVVTLGEMMASIAHEINQPLAAVVNNASACLRWLKAQNLDEARQSASLVIADGHRASEIIGRIRALAKKAPPQKGWLDINDAISEVIDLMPSEVQRNHVSLQTQLSDDLPLILGDRIQLQQVILNLMMNAIEAMSGVGEVPRGLWVSSERVESGDILIAVRDSGPGLDPKSLDRLFDAFYTTKPQGLGMGLAISRSIIEAHGGRLWATANVPHGAVFQFTLPIGSEGVA